MHTDAILQLSEASPSDFGAVDVEDEAAESRRTEDELYQTSTAVRNNGQSPTYLL